MFRRSMALTRGVCPFRSLVFDRAALIARIDPRLIDPITPMQIYGCWDTSWSATLKARPFGGQFFVLGGKQLEWILCEMHRNCLS